MKTRLRNRIILLMVAMAVVTAGSTQLQASQTGTCGGQTITIPFDDVLPANIFFCSIASAYFTGLANGTTATTYRPSDPVTREQMAAFVTRTLDQSLKRGSQRAALNQHWTTQGAGILGLTDVGAEPRLVKSDGADVWVANVDAATVSRVRASDGRLLETWTGATNAYGVLCAMGRVFVTGSASPGNLYQIDPTQPAGAVTVVSSALGPFPQSIAFDGQRIWTANLGGSVSIITLPVTVTNVTTGFTSPLGIIYDGANIWVTDDISGSVDKLRKLDSTGAILLSVDVGDGPGVPAFDGTNIWVPNFSSSSVSVVRATGGLAGTVIATLTGNGLLGAQAIAFDGERILVTNEFGDSVSLWKASDLTPIGTFSTGTGTHPFGACSDGLNFWITLHGTSKLARF
jgi:DNA-binding beta-propeller fold protein YncE